MRSNREIWIVIGFLFFWTSLVSYRDISLRFLSLFGAPSPICFHHFCSFYSTTYIFVALCRASPSRHAPR
ncbi:hypothetical protein DFP73DRAFT_333929 [Morchella snyderi]|nr:hypothetical protein DFP73DRAFT_333929 [Morchella snyderi]